MLTYKHTRHRTQQFFVLFVTYFLQWCLSRYESHRQSGLEFSWKVARVSEHFLFDRACLCHYVIFGELNKTVDVV